MAKGLLALPERERYEAADGSGDLDADDDPRAIKGDTSPSSGLAPE